MAIIYVCTHVFSHNYFCWTFLLKKHIEVHICSEERRDDLKTKVAAFLSEKEPVDCIPVESVTQVTITSSILSFHFNLKIKILRMQDEFYRKF
mgnify:CR=1 FL=1